VALLAPVLAGCKKHSTSLIVAFVIGKTLHIPSFSKNRSPWLVCTFGVIPEQGKCVEIFLFVPMRSTKLK
jgi:hypothetical protein